MFNPIVKRSLKGATLTSLILAGIGACSADDTSSTTAGPTTATTSGGGSGGAPATSSTTNGGGGSSSTTSTGGSAGSGGSGGATGGSAGTGGSGGTGGSAGSSGTAGSGGSAGGKDAGTDSSVGKDGGGGGSTSEGGAGTCTPMGPAPNAQTGYVRTGWKGQWTPPCNFRGDYAPCSQYLPGNAFDGMSNRTTIGTTNCCTSATDANCNANCNNTRTAEKIGDTFTFDMQQCKAVSRVEMYCGEPPDNHNFDRRDFPGQVEVTVSSDCTTSATGEITGTFTAFDPPLLANEPTTANNMPCSLSTCTGPFAITFPANTAARCIRMRLTKVLAAGGGVWWATDEIYVK